MYKRGRSTGNPFVYGEAVSGAYFTDREKETKELKTELKNGQNIIIFSPRRYGKTSLIKKILSELKREGVLTVYIDLFFVNSKQKFIEVFAEAIAKSFSGPVSKTVNALKNLIPKLIPKVVFKAGGASFEFEFDRTKNAAPILEDLYESIYRIILRKKKKAVVVFDEFQEILSFDSGEIESGMRAKFQFHRNIAYVFLGSKRKLMQKLFEDKSRPFYNSGRKYPLKKIDDFEFSKFIRSRMSQTDIAIEEAVIEKILAITKCHPYYTQELCHFIWENSQENGKASEKEIDKAIKEILIAESANYNNIWENLTAKQKGLLIALAANPTANVYSKDFINNNQLGASSTVQRLIKLLYEKQILEKDNGLVFFDDVFFERWIRENSN